MQIYRTQKNLKICATHFAHLRDRESVFLIWQAVSIFCNNWEMLSVDVNRNRNTIRSERASPGAAQMTGGTRVCDSDSWVMLCHVRERDSDLWIGTPEPSRAPHHNATEPGEPFQTEQMGHAAELLSISLSAPFSFPDPNTIWHLINMLSESFISLMSRCLSSVSPLKTTRALITQNSIGERERDAG